jgi:hypothetical protein
LFSLVRKEINGRRGDRASLIRVFNFFDIWLVGHCILTIVDAFIDCLRQVVVLRLRLDGGLLRLTRFYFRRFLGADYRNNVLRMVFRLEKVEFLEVLVQLVDIGHGLIHDSFAVIFAKFHCKILFLDRMEKGTNF